MLLLFCLNYSKYYIFFFIHLNVYYLHTNLGLKNITNPGYLCTISENIKYWDFYDFFIFIALFSHLNIFIH